MSSAGRGGWMNQPGEADQKVLNRECGRLKLSLEAGKALGGEPIVFLHYPPVYAKRRMPSKSSMCSCLMGLSGSITAISMAIQPDMPSTGSGWALISGLLSCDFLQFVPKQIV